MTKKATCSVTNIMQSIGKWTQWRQTSFRFHLFRFCHEQIFKYSFPLFTQKDASALGRGDQEDNVPFLLNAMAYVRMGATGAALVNLKINQESKAYLLYGVSVNEHCLYPFNSQNVR